MSDVYATINYVLVNLINEIWEVEGKAIITDEFKDITNNDMHVIEAIGPVPQQRGSTGRVCTSSGKRGKCISSSRRLS